MTPCRFFQQGNCRFGEKCRFEHTKPLVETGSQLQKRTHSPSDRPSKEVKKSRTEPKGKKIPKVFAAATSRPPKYVPPTFQPSETVRYTFSSDQKLWDAQTRSYSKTEHVDWSKLDVVGIKNVEFGSRYDIKDSDVVELIKRPELCAQLERFYAGDSDTGNGGFVRDESQFISFVKLCENIRVFHLEAFTCLSDATLTTIFESCPKIESVHLSGNDKIQGRVTGPALQNLASKPQLAPSLKVLHLYDQTFKLQDKIKQLSRARPTLFIHNGETLGDGIADNMIAGMTGGAQTYSWLGGKMDSMDTDYGLYGPGGYDLDMSFMMDTYDDYGFDNY